MSNMFLVTVPNYLDEIQYTNSNRPDAWKADTDESIQMYNDWYTRIVPDVYRDSREKTKDDVAEAFFATDLFRRITDDVLLENPKILPILRMATSPLMARDRLIGLSGASVRLVTSMEVGKRIPPKKPLRSVYVELDAIANTIVASLDRVLFPWVFEGRSPAGMEIEHATEILADRWCNLLTDTILRNAHEQRQMVKLREWLKAHGYKETNVVPANGLQNMLPGTFSFRTNIPIRRSTAKKGRMVVPVDAIVMPHCSKGDQYPVLIEMKSAGDITNTYKRRKEEVTKSLLLKATYGESMRLTLFLCGYFERNYLAFNATHGIDWVWEHRVEDFEVLGL